MPAVKKGESRSDYGKRCIPEAIKEGKSQKAAVGKCMGMYSGKWHMKKKGGK